MNQLEKTKLQRIVRKKKIVSLFSLILIIFSTIIILEAKPQKISENILDGVISTGEYSHSQSVDDGNFILFWEITNENSIFFAMQVKTTGWVAIGLNPTELMKDADMYFGWVNSTGGVEMIDAYSTGRYGPHPPDITLGGEDNILDFNGSEITGVTVIEFKRLIVTPDSDFDNPIPLVNEIPVIWAYGLTDNYLDQHAGGNRGTMFWRVQGASVLNFDFSQPFILGLAFLITLSGLLIYVDSKGRPAKNDNDQNNGE